MSKRLYLVAGFAVSLLSAAPSICPAQAGRGVTLEWQNAPLRHVVGAFAKLSGRTIVVAPDVGDPEVTASVHNVDWRSALDIVLMTHGLVARVDASGVIRIEKQTPVPAKTQGTPPGADPDAGNTIVMNTLFRSAT